MGPAGVSMVTINAPAAPGLKAAVSIKKVTVTADTFEV
jgi:hypothetical protein